jgi:hypothetical protein
MKYAKWVLLTLFGLALASSSGCFGPADKPLTEGQKKQIDDDMQKAIKFNASGGGASGDKKGGDDDMQNAIQKNKAKN